MPPVSIDNNSSISTLNAINTSYFNDDNNTIVCKHTIVELVDEPPKIYMFIGNLNKEKFDEYSININNIKSIIIGEGIKQIDENTFMNAQNLEFVLFPKSIETINYRSFYQIPKLSQVLYREPSNMRVLGEESFAYCTELKVFGPL